MLHLKKYLLSLFSGCKRVLSSVVVALKFNRFALKCLKVLKIKTIFF